MESGDECAPDVLVLPSRLKQFSKVKYLRSYVAIWLDSWSLQVVDCTSVINPSFLSKGTYATLSYVGQGSGLAKDRITADISRIS